MKINFYYRTVFRRRNAVKETFYDFFLAFCSIPRLLLEVFIRRDFGERYFSFFTAIMTAIVLAIYPIIMAMNTKFISLFGYAHEYSFIDFLVQYLTWYVFLVWFVILCNKRENEIKHLPSVFDFARFSLSTGMMHEGFLNYKIKGQPATVRTIETRLEPGLFFLLGIGLWVFSQPLGLLLIGSSIFYSISYRAAYHRGDNFIMDNIDEMICNEELTSAFIDGLGPAETRGVNYYGRKPMDATARKMLADNFVRDTEIVEAR